MKLPYSLDRSVLVRARRATVFSFFTDNARFAAWWGEGSTIEPRPGGAVVIRYPNGIMARGEVEQIEAPDRIVFTFGYDSGQPIPPGSSRVTITFGEDPGGTQVALRHEFDTELPRDQHVPGWRFQLSQFANIASAAEHERPDETVDAFFALWSETDAVACTDKVAALCTERVGFFDPMAALVGRDELVAHISASQQFVPGVVLERKSAVRHCQGTLLVDWQMVKDGDVIGEGSNVFELVPDGRVARVVGLPDGRG